MHGANSYVISIGTDWLSQTETFESPAILLEDGRVLGPANAIHNRIGKLGNGRFSFWKGDLYFSSSDNSDPRANGRSYILAIPVELEISYIFGFVIVLSVGSLAISPVGKYLVLILDWIWINVVPGVSVTVVLLLVFFIGGEIYFRKTIPFINNYWPTKFDEHIGFTFIPNETVYWTNHLDYWTVTHVNSLGFLDREPPLALDLPDTCRVAFIGDSMVEGAQVPIEDKMHVQFEKIANTSTMEGQKIRTVAFGYSGSGQVNQIPFYDSFARFLDPDVVVLVFVNNDFGNNSAVLEGVRAGWHPLHPPRLFYEYDERTDRFSKIDIDPNWMDYLLPTAPPVTPNISS
jgi:hypothetical protein